MNKLNENEKFVLKELFKSSKGNGHDFGYTDEIVVEGLSKHQVAGYISAIADKDIIKILDHVNCRSFEFKRIDDWSNKKLTDHINDLIENN